MDLVDDFDSNSFTKIENLYDDGKLDGDTLGEMSRLLKAEDGNLPIDRKSKFIDGDVDGEQLLHLVDRNVNLKKTKMLVEDKKGNVRWLQLGNKEFGWKHILKRHILGTYAVKNKRTSFFPVGQTKGDLGSEISKMPPNRNQLYDVLGDWNKNKEVAEENINELIFKAIKNTDPDGHKYTYSPNVNGISKIFISTENKGSITTAYPERGSKVNHWIERIDSWESGKSSNPLYKVGYILR